MYKDLDTGTLIDEEDALSYAREMVEGGNEFDSQEFKEFLSDIEMDAPAWDDDDFCIEFIEWYYSGNYIRFNPERWEDDID